MSHPQKEDSDQHSVWKHGKDWWTKIWETESSHVECKGNWGENGRITNITAEKVNWLCDFNRKKKDSRALIQSTKTPSIIKENGTKAKKRELG
jgi:hypothetical protein